MKWFVFAFVFIILCGALRRWFFRHWRFTLPAYIWGAVSWYLSVEVFRLREPWWATGAVCALAALGAGASAKLWLDSVFGKGE